MSEKRILIASLLKPVNDTRLYEKLAVSLSSLPDSQVHVCGFEAPLPKAAPRNVFFHPVFSFRRLSAGRFQAQLKFYNLLQELKPQVIIAGTHELLLPCYFYSLKYNVKLVYDVRENYALNLKKQQNYSFLLKHILAWGVRSIEEQVAPRIDHFILAEKSYAHELPFISGMYTVVENKYKPAATYSLPATPVTLANAPLRLLYSGTIAAEYGIFEAVDLADRLYHADNTTTLTIIGYCASQRILAALQQQIKDKPYIRIIGGNKLVPHQTIVGEISKSNVGLLPYQPNDSTFRCIPTKLYEYMAHALPILVQHNPLWHSIVMQYQAGLSVDFKNIDELELLNNLRQTSFYTSGVPKNVFWTSEEEKLLGIFS